MTQNQPISLQQAATEFGTIMGLIWIAKFTFLPLGFSYPLLQLLFIVLTCFVPFLGYLFVRRFRQVHCGGVITFSQAFTFTVLMYLFATLLTAVAHYIYFKYIDNGFLVNSYIEQLEAMKPTANDEMKQNIEQFVDAFSLISSLTPLEMTFQLITQNFTYGIFLALPTGLLAMRKKPKHL